MYCRPVGLTFIHPVLPLLLHVTWKIYNESCTGKILIDTGNVGRLQRSALWMSAGVRL